MKKFIFFLTVYVVACLIPSGCGVKDQPISQSEANAVQIEGTAVVLSDEGITVDGAAISADTSAAVYATNDIVYYEEGKDFTYGEGTEADAHSAEEAAAHTVVHITQPGTYVLSGTLSKGQVAVDLGENAEEDPEAVVTLVLNGVDIACEVAPAVIFYDVYECGSTDTETACETVDTTAAGDTFTGYFLAGLIEGMPIPQILKMSAKASSIAVTREGAVPSIPYRDEVMGALAEV